MELPTSIPILKPKPINKSFVACNIGNRNNFNDYHNSSEPTHAEILLDYFHSFSANTDIVVRWDGKLVRNAHRLILSAFSTNFENVLKTLHNVIANLEIDSAITGVAEKELSDVIDYMYYGKIKPSKKILDALRIFGCHSIVNLLSQFDNEENRDLIIEVSDHADCFLMAIERLYNEMIFFDCVLTFEDNTTINCHRQILCAFSNVFQQALKNTDGCESLNIDMNSMSTAISRFA